MHLDLSISIQFLNLWQMRSAVEYCARPQPYIGIIFHMAVCIRLYRTADLSDSSISITHKNRPGQVFVSKNKFTFFSHIISTHLLTVLIIYAIFLIEQR